jgi:hypothetical protein
MVEKSIVTLYSERLPFQKSEDKGINKKYRECYILLS